MPKHRYQRREPTHDWQQIRPLLKDQVQITYAVIRPVILFGVNPTERSDEWQPDDKHGARVSAIHACTIIPIKALNCPFGSPTRWNGM
jgi:hypothetical protein